MSFKDFVASHTGRQFFDAFREFVGVFKTYVQQLTIQNQIVEAHQRAMGAEYQRQVDEANISQAVMEAFQAEAAAIDANTPENLPCMCCQEICSSATNILMGWRGAVSLICVACAREKGLIDDSSTN
jgi:hypothetical protein